MSQLAVSAVTVDYGGGPVLHDVTFTVHRGERWGIVGRNGSGKTTLFNLITGTVEPTFGHVRRATALRLTLLDQQRDFGTATTVWDAAASSLDELRTLETSLHAQAEAIAQAGAEASTQMLERYDRDLERFSREGGYTYESRIDAVLHGLGFDPVHARTQPLVQLSGGERGRIGLARQLVAPADVIMLDEPTNHLDLDTTHWLEQYLRDIDTTVLLISHDRAFLEAVVDHVLHVDNATVTPYAGSYSTFVEQRSARRHAQQRAFDVQQKVVAAEEDYIRRNIAGQNSRQAKGRRTRLARLPRLTAPEGEERVMSLRLEANERGGDQVLVARDVSLVIGQRTLLERFNTRVMRGEVIGFVGPNGSGKSTLLRAIVGEQRVSTGHIVVGESVVLAYYRQDLTQVPTGRSLFDVIHDLRPLWERGQVQSHLGRFGFSGDAVQRRAETLSGGERARVALAMLMLGRANFMLLDEPTNHLDVESIEALEDAVTSFDGSVIIVSHDRELLRNVAQRVWSFSGTRIDDFAGTFGEWEAEQQSRAQTAARDEAERVALEKSGARAVARQREARARVDRSARAALRNAVTHAEAGIARLEEQIAALRSRLEDPELYVNADGVLKSLEIKQELDAAETALEHAFVEWSNATEALEASG